MLYKLALFLHLFGFAAYAGAMFAQQRFMAASRRQSIAAQMRDTYESLSASIITKIALPAAFLSVLSGVTMLYERPFWFRNMSLHIKLTIVVILLILTHLEMFNARKLVRARRAQGDAAAAEIDRRKGRHAVFGLVGLTGVIAILAIVSFGFRP